MSSLSQAYFVCESRRFLYPGVRVRVLGDSYHPSLLPNRALATVARLCGMQLQNQHKQRIV
jgi:hypothetical protein